MENISVDELKQRLDSQSNKYLVLDVRTPEEFNEGRIEGARNVPHEEVGSVVDELKDYEMVYVHCKMGGRAKMAAQNLVSAGLQNIVCVGDGGMQKWREMGWPLEK